MASFRRCLSALLEEDSISLPNTTGSSNEKNYTEVDNEEEDGVDDDVIDKKQESDNGDKSDSSGLSLALSLKSQESNFAENC